MADENVKDETVEDVTETPEGDKKTDAKQDKKGEKKFTDGDMATLRRNKDKELSDARASFETEKSTLQATIDSQNKAIQAVVDALLKDLELDEDVKELLSEKSAIDQLTFLQKKAEAAGKRDIPRTPAGDGKRTQKYTFKTTNTV